MLRARKTSPTRSRSGDWEIGIGGGGARLRPDAPLAQGVALQRYSSCKAHRQVTALRKPPIRVFPQNPWVIAAGAIAAKSA